MKHTGIMSCSRDYMNWENQNSKQSNIKETLNNPVNTVFTGL